jgi:hypothetical protein
MQRTGLQLKVVDNGCSRTGVSFTGLYRRKKLSLPLMCAELS